MRTASIVLLICSLFSSSPEDAVLNIRITNIRNQTGVIRISVYTAPEQYPYYPARTYEVNKDSLSGGTLNVTIRDLKPGQYGLCFLDDENRSGQMDSNRLGIPQEGFGFANNPKPFLKRPDYAHVLFKLSPGINHMQLITRYKN
ncbi:MAG: DUF2141 domain-containing protein [Bacteroidales bacterium]|jgi:uncharacterized protein (DUF2141 family)